jgi:competence protein ComEC
VLLTGDIEAESEQELLNDAAPALKSDVLIAPHHGSKTSSTVEFLEQVNPKLILIPAAYKNRYHFPDSSIIERYQKQKINWLMTGTAGAIKVKIRQTGLESFSYRAEQAKYWHDK